MNIKYEDFFWHRGFIKNSRYTIRDRNSKERRCLLDLWEMIARIIITLLLHFYFHHLYAALLMHRDSIQENQIWIERKLTFIMILTLIVGCESLSLQSKCDKALHYCSDKSFFCRDLKMKILIIPLSNCHSTSSLWELKLKTIFNFSGVMLHIIFCINNYWAILY